MKKPPKYVWMVICSDGMIGHAWPTKKLATQDAQPGDRVCRYVLRQRDELVSLNTVRA